MQKQIESVHGKITWTVLEKLSEGDAGVIYVVRPENADITESAILKRPQNSPLAAERQGPQISQEGELLEKLLNFSVAYGDVTANPVKFIDKNLFATKKEDTFIVIENARGISLKQMIDITKNETRNYEDINLNKLDQIALENIRGNKKIPELIILRALFILLEFLEKLHKNRIVLQNGQNAHGVIWNDVKPDHIFWSPGNKTFTIIDWGNSQFLNANGTSLDGNYSEGTDFTQYIISMGGFLNQASEKLYKSLNWPHSIENIDELPAIITKLRSRLRQELVSAENIISNLKQEAINITGSPLNNFDEIIEIHEKIIEQGETPDFLQSEIFACNLIKQLAENDRIDDCIKICRAINKFPFYSQQKWGILLKLLLNDKERHGDIFIRKAITEVTATEIDWDEVIWNLRQAPKFENTSNTEAEIITLIRYIQLGFSLDTKLPFEVLQQVNQFLENKEVALKRGGLKEDTEPFHSIKKFKALKIDWSKVPDGKSQLLASFVYKDILDILDEIGNKIDGVHDLKLELENTINPLVGLADNFWHAWATQEFEQAKRLLKRLLVYDPDCYRVYVFYDCLLQIERWRNDSKTTSLTTMSKNELLDEGRKTLNLLGDNSAASDKSQRATWLYEEMEELRNKRTEFWSGIINPSPTPTKDKDQRNYELDEFYEHVKTQRFFQAQEMIEQGALTENSSFYSNLVNIVENISNGVFTPIPATRPNIDDTEYPALKDILSEIINWYEELSQTGIAAANHVYKNTLQPRAQEWTFLQGITEKQDKINTYINFFRRVQEKKWGESQDSLITIDDGSIKETIKGLLESIESVTRFFNSNNKFHHEDFKTATLGMDSCINRFKSEIERKKQSSNPGEIWKATDWNKLLSILKIFQETATKSRQAYDLFNNSPRGFKKTKGRDFLTKLEFLEENLTSSEVKQSKVWMSTFDKITNKGMSSNEAGLQPSHPLYDYLSSLGPLQSSRSWQQYWQSALAIIGLMLVVIVGFGLFISIWKGTFISLPTQASQQKPTESPHPTDTSTVTPASTPQLTLTPEPTMEIQLPIISTGEPGSIIGLPECQLVREFVQNNEWKKYQTFLKEKEAEYEILKSQCRWNQEFFYRNIDVQLRSAQHYASNGDNSKAKDVVEGLFRDTLKIDPSEVDIPRARDIYIFIQELRVYINLCGGLPNGYINEDDKSKFLSVFEPQDTQLKDNWLTLQPQTQIPWHGDLFNKLCGKEPDYFSQKQVSEQSFLPKNLLSGTLYPYLGSNGVKNCIYFDGNYFHYFPEGNYNCKISDKNLKDSNDSPLSFKTIDKFTEGMCIVSPNNRLSEFSYGISVSQINPISSNISQSYSFMFNNGNQKLIASLPNQIRVAIDDKNESQFCNNAIYVTFRVIGNLLLWNFWGKVGFSDEGIWDTGQYYFGAILDDESINLPIEITLTGSPPKAPSAFLQSEGAEEEKLHITIIKLEIITAGGE